MGNKRPFNKYLYDKSDSFAKKVVIDWLATFNIKAEINPNKYGIDLLIKHNNIVTPCEVEKRHDWQGSYFPFTSIHIPQRKEKFFINNIKYVTVNRDGTYLMAIDSDRIKECEIIEFYNKYVDKTEYFYDVPRDKFKVIKI